MSTTHVQSLPNVRGRMSYTEFGEGKRRREHLENGTDRIAAQMGDAASREDFIVYCEGQKHRHPNAVNEGYEARDALNHPCPNLLAGAWVFAKAGRDAKDPVSRMMADMTAMMLRMLLQQAMEEQRRREREAAERRLYESRKNMWDAEKCLKSAEKALAHEDEREDKAARRAGGRVKYGADADKQYE